MYKALLYNRLRLGPQYTTHITNTTVARILTFRALLIPHKDELVVITPVLLGDMGEELQ